MCKSAGNSRAQTARGNAGDCPKRDANAEAGSLRCVIPLVFNRYSPCPVCASSPPPPSTHRHGRPLLGGKEGSRLRKGR